jgi:hypothetical protein
MLFFTFFIVIPSLTYGKNVSNDKEFYDVN